MATRNIVPRNAGEGSLGTQSKPWNNVCANAYNGLNKDLFAKMAAHACIDDQTLFYPRGFTQYRMYNDGHVEMWGVLDSLEQHEIMIIPLPIPVKRYSVTFGYVLDFKYFYSVTLLHTSTEKELHIIIAPSKENICGAQLFGHLSWQLLGQK